MGYQCVVNCKYWKRNDKYDLISFKATIVILISISFDNNMSNYVLVHCVKSFYKVQICCCAFLNIIYYGKENFCGFGNSLVSTSFWSKPKLGLIYFY